MIGLLRTLAAAIALASSLVAAPGPPSVTYAPPTDAAVADPFRPPPQPWLAGNRGIEYATRPGQPVHAIGAGVVAFAGSVAGRAVVSLVHADGLRSSYVGLTAVRVAVGERVALGQVIARASAQLHLGVRRGRTYLDPASLWSAATVRGRVRLVPVTRPAATLGVQRPGRYTRSSTHQPVGRAIPSTWFLPTVAVGSPRRCFGTRFPKPLERSDPCRIPSSP